MAAPPRAPRVLRASVAIALVACVGGCTMLAGISDFETSTCAPDACPADAIVEPSQGDCHATPSALVSVGGFSIDATEVTNAQYATFLANAKDTSTQPAACIWNTSFVPSSGWPAPGARCNDPVVFVDWCDAAAFCAWAGKRLCGNPSGGAVAFVGNAFQTVAGSAWYAACSANGKTTYPYGATPDGAATPICVDDAYDGVNGTQPSDVAHAVGSASGCHGATVPFTQLFDLAGNVREWEDDCQQSIGGGDGCRARGGGFEDPPIATSCDKAVQLRRDTAAPDLGFRCCSP